jgi:hypothetical protein
VGWQVDRPTLQVPIEHVAGACLDEWLRPVAHSHFTCHFTQQDPFMATTAGCTGVKKNNQLV